jgi:energy-coupling factor transport system ATP-binding protein
MASIPVESGAGPGLAISSLTVHYFGRDTPALSDVSVDVRPGALVGIAGRNGAGKSTLALAAAGLIPRVVRARLEGTVTADGVPLGTSEGVASHVGIVFPNPHNQISATKATVREELAFGLENLGVTRAEMERRIEAIAARLGLSELLDRYPFALSGGEQQRVAIGSVVALGGRVLVLDEPTGQLDPAGTETVRDLLLTQAEDGTAVLCAEHSDVVLATADRVLVLDAGRSVGIATPRVALSGQALAASGLEPPTIIRLAELAGLGVDDPLDDEHIADALAGAAVGPDRRPTDGDDRSATDLGGRFAVRDGALLEIADLRYRYPTGIDAVRGVDLRVEPGERVAIVGQNGSGKTTLVKHINGLLRPSTGRVSLAGRDLSTIKVHEAARTIGFVFQNPDDQLFNRSVERELAFGPRNLAFSSERSAQLIDAALSAAQLQGVRSDNPYDLGYSDRKLVALASVLAMDPAILVLDEPTTGQDGPGVAQVGAIVDGLSAIGRTVIAITHDMEFAARHFGRIVVMRQGEVVADGTPEAVFAPGQEELLASTGLRPPLAARIGAKLGLGSTPTVDALLDALAVADAVVKPD